MTSKHVYPSKYNIILNAKGFDEGFAILNPLSGAFDLTTAEEISQMEALSDGSSINQPLTDYLLSRGYLYEDPREEEKTLGRKLESFTTALTESPTQVFLIPSYGCNLSCSYCYQRGMEKGAGLISLAMVDYFFNHLRERFKNEKVKPFITLFGGEPLIDTPVHRLAIQQIVKRAAEGDYELAVVTNGFDLTSYLDVLAECRIKEIQVTVDGPEEMHNRRRPDRKGGRTFDRIIRGIEGAVSRGFSVNLRVVVDRENLSGLVALAEDVDNRGWLDLDVGQFKTQIGRNYQLFSCDGDPGTLFSPLQMWEEFTRLALAYPVVAKFHQPEFYNIRHLVLTGEMPLPLFDSCPAGKKEWVYDLNGDIYGCTASCGRKEYRLGSYTPESLDASETMMPWTIRSVLNIPQCRECNLSLVCGGGCGVVAMEKNGSVLSPNCRPVKELLELGLSYYRDQIISLA
ncbi:MAG: radical SAM protein [Bacillota bacterium]